MSQPRTLANLDRLSGYQLLHDGTLTLSRMENNGIKIDMAYLSQAMGEVSDKIQSLTDRIRASKEFYYWSRRFGSDTNLNSIKQLEQVLTRDLGLVIKEKTDKGFPKLDEASLKDFGLSFLNDFIECKKFKKLLTTYLEGISREVQDGYLHPNFLLNTVQTFRSSSASPNFQNIPVRSKTLAEYIRRCFIPRKNRRLVEIDFSGIEVRIAACYHKDPTMLEYIKDKSKDMHRDMAQECYMLSSPKEINRDSRYCAKNQFVFPQFYGSTYVNCAKALWESLTKMNLVVGDTKKKLSDHLREKGITQLGKCDREKDPVSGTFEYHIKEVQNRFWQERFPVYTQWKYDWYDAYRANGYFDMITGFRCKGLFSKNEVINYPVQSAAFHCLLWSIIEIQKWLDRTGKKSKLVGQIHDSLIADVVEEELQDFLNYAHKTMTIRLLNHWEWVIVPLEVEVDVTPVNGSWHEKALWEKNGELWQKKEK